MTDDENVATKDKPMMSMPLDELIKRLDKIRDGPHRVLETHRFAVDIGHAWVTEPRHYPEPSIELGHGYFVIHSAQFNLQGNRALKTADFIGFIEREGLRHYHHSDIHEACGGLYKTSFNVQASNEILDTHCYKPWKTRGEGIQGVEIYTSHCWKDSTLGAETYDNSLEGCLRRPFIQSLSIDASFHHQESVAVLGLYERLIDMIDSKAIAIRPVLFHELLDEYNLQSKRPITMEEYLNRAGMKEVSLFFDSQKAVTLVEGKEVLPAEFQEFLRRYKETNKDRVVYQKVTNVDDKHGKPPRTYESFIILVKDGAP